MSFNPQFYSLLINASISVEINYLEAFWMFENMIVLSLFCGSGFRCEDLCFCFRIGNDNMLKRNNEICLKCENPNRGKCCN